MLLFAWGVFRFSLACSIIHGGCPHFGRCQSIDNLTLGPSPINKDLIRDGSSVIDSSLAVAAWQALPAFVACVMSRVYRISGSCLELQYCTRTRTEYITKVFVIIPGLDHTVRTRSVLVLPIQFMLIDLCKLPGHRLFQGELRTGSFMGKGTGHAHFGMDRSSYS